MDERAAQEKADDDAAAARAEGIIFLLSVLFNCSYFHTELYQLRKQATAYPFEYEATDFAPISQGHSSW